MFPSPLFIALWSFGIIPLILAPFYPALFGIILLYDLSIILLLIIDHKLTPNSKNFEIERITPNTSLQNHPTPITIMLKNLTSSDIILSLADEIPAHSESSKKQFNFTLQAKKTSTLKYTLTTSMRGDLFFGVLRIDLKSKLGLFIRNIRFSTKQQLSVYPSLIALKKYDLLARTQRIAQGGLRLLKRQGKGSEFERLREYTHDDQYKDINWKATAKRRLPITQVYQTERSQNLMIVLDFGRTMGNKIGSQSKLDIAIESALLLCHVAQHLEDRFGLLLFSHKAQRFIAPQKGQQHFQRILKALYNLEPLSYDIQYRELFRFLATQHRKRSLVVFFTDLGDEEAAEQMQRYMPLLKPTHLPLCISISDPSIIQRSTKTPQTKEELFLRGAALELLQQREHIIASLRQNGVLFIDQPPEQISPETINQYLNIKAKQLL